MLAGITIKIRSYKLIETAANAGFNQTGAGEPFGDIARDAANTVDGFSLSKSFFCF